MRKLVLAIAVILMIVVTGIVLCKYFFCTTNNISLYNKNYDGSCTYLVDNFNDDERVLISVLEQTYKAEAQTCSFVTNLKGVNYSDGQTYTDGVNTDLFYFEKCDNEFYKFSYISIFLLKPEHFSFKQETLADSCAIYTGSFHDLNLKSLGCVLKKIEMEKIEKRHDSFSYVFFNHEKQKWIKMLYENRGKCLRIQIKNGNLQQTARSK